MFEHSIKVPRLYKTAANILKTVKENGGSLKSLVYEKKHVRVGQVYSLVMKAIQNGLLIAKLLKKSKILELEPRLDPFLAEILITQLLWGKKKLASESKPIKIILSNEEKFRELAAAESNYDKPPQPEVNKPRYIRVNTLKITVNEVLEELRDGGWTMQKYLQKDDYEGFLAKVQELGEYDFMLDLHFPDLLIFNKAVKFYTWKSFKEKGIFLQDKASCLSTFILNPPPGSTVLDMCAAPGMKTLHLAALMENKGKVYASELSTDRFKAMQDVFESSGATCIESMCKDVLTIKQGDLPGVEYILVDPSCSGTGIVTRHDLFQNNSTEEEARVKKLQGFQILILKHAVRSFPNTKRIVYSTCSLNPQENEAVVQDVISQSFFYRLADAKDYLKAPWVNFGSKDYGVIGERCLYSKPETDLCNGFFIAVLERLQEGETNDLLIESQNKSKKSGNKAGSGEGSEKPRENNFFKASLNRQKKADAKNKKGDDIKIETSKENVFITQSDETIKAKKKKNKNKKLESVDISVNENEKNQSVLLDVDTEINVTSSKKKKKSRKNSINQKDDDTEIEMSEENVANTQHKRMENDDCSESTKAKKKKKKNIDLESEDIPEVDKRNDIINEKNLSKLLEVDSEINVTSSKKKKKSGKNSINPKDDTEIEMSEENVVNTQHKQKESDDCSESTKAKKKKKKSTDVESEDIPVVDEKNEIINEKNQSKLLEVDSEINVTPSKKKKKSRKNSINQKDDTEIEMSEENFVNTQHNRKESDDSSETTKAKKKIKKNKELESVDIPEVDEENKSKKDENRSNPPHVDIETNVTSSKKRKKSKEILKEGVQNESPKENNSLEANAENESPKKVKKTKKQN